MNYKDLKTGLHFQEQIKKFNNLQDLFIRNKEQNKREFLSNFFQKMQNIADDKIKKEMADYAFKCLEKYIKTELKEYNVAFNKL